MYTVFGIEQCPSCKKAKKLLEEKDIGFTYVNLDEKPERFLQLKELGLKTVPQVFDEYYTNIGGYEDLCSHLNV